MPIVGFGELRPASSRGCAQLRQATFPSAFLPDLKIQLQMRAGSHFDYGCSGIGLQDQVTLTAGIPGPDECALAWNSDVGSVAPKCNRSCMRRVDRDSG